MNSKTFLVGLREYRSTVMTKAFILGAIVLPLVIWGLAIAIPLLIKDEIPVMHGKVVVVDETGMVAPMFISQLTPEFLRAQKEQLATIDVEKYLEKTTAALGSKAEFARPLVLAQGRRAIEKMRDQPLHELEFENITPPSSANIEQLKEQVRAGEILAVVHIKADALTHISAWLTGFIRSAASGALGGAAGSADAPAAPEGEEKSKEEPRAVIYTNRTMHVDNSGLLSERLSGAIVAMRMITQEVDALKAQVAMTPPDISVRNVTETGEIESNEVSNMLVPLAFMMLLWISTFTGGQYLLTTTIEEKSSKVIEVLLSATSPMQLMTGKILGQGAVALTMLLLYAAMGVGALRQFDLEHLVEPMKILLVAPYFIMAFFFIACMMASIGSAVNEMREAQALMGPVMMIVMLPLLAWMPIVKSPNGSFATIASFVPPMTPFVMALRLGTNQVIPFWQIAATIVIGFAAMLIFIWLTAKIFRIGILMHGKAPNFMTLLRWVRQA